MNAIGEDVVAGTHHKRRISSLVDVMPVFLRTIPESNILETHYQVTWWIWNLPYSGTATFRASDQNGKRTAKAVNLNWPDLV